MTALFFLLAVAVAEVPARDPATVSVGFSTLVRDPVLNRRGFSLAAALPAGQRAKLGLRLEGFPNLGKTDWTALMHRIPRNASVPMSRVMATGLVELELVLVDDGSWATLATYGSVGAVFTDDDLQQAGSAGDEAAERYERQWHPTGLVGLLVDAGGPTVGVRVRAGFGAYTERIVLAGVTSTPLREPRYPMELGVAVRWSPATR